MNSYFFELFRYLVNIDSNCINWCFLANFLQMRLQYLLISFSYLEYQVHRHTSDICYQNFAQTPKDFVKSFLPPEAGLVQELRPTPFSARCCLPYTVLTALFFQSETMPYSLYCNSGALHC